MMAKAALSEPALTAFCLHFTAEVQTPLALGEHKGAAIRGALVQAMRRFCARSIEEQPDCADCLVRPACPVAELIATARPDERRGRDAPRPYTIEPPLQPEKLNYEPGERLTFGFTLLGSATQMLPYPVLAAAALEQTGLGRPARQPDGRFRRGSLRLHSIQAYHPLTGETQEVLPPGGRMVQVPQIPVTHADVLLQAEALAGHAALSFHFLSPLRLVDGGRLVHTLSFRPFFQRLLERLSLLWTHFAGRQAPYDARALIARAGEVRLLADETRWVELASYSSRLGRATPIGGLVGRATFACEDWRPFLPWLVWGQVTHVGKDAVKGNGWYRIEDVGGGGSSQVGMSEAPTPGAPGTRGG